MGIRPGLLAAMLKADHLHGVIRWKVDIDDDSVNQELSIVGASALFLDSRSVVNVEEFLSTAGRQLECAPTTGMTIDNFSSAILALPKRSVIVWTGWQEFVGSDPAGAALIVDVLDDAIQQISGTVLVLGKVGAMPNVAELTALS